MFSINSVTKGAQMARDVQDGHCLHVVVVGIGQVEAQGLLSLVSKLRSTKLSEQIPPKIMWQSRSLVQIDASLAGPANG